MVIQVSHTPPHNCTAFADNQDIVAFIERLAEVHALPLPGRMPNHKDKARLLPSDISKSEVYRQYKQACILKSTQPVSWAKFYCLWSELLPHISHHLTDVLNANRMLLNFYNVLILQKMRRLVG